MSAVAGIKATITIIDATVDENRLATRLETLLKEMGETNFSVFAQRSVPGKMPKPVRIVQKPKPTKRPQPQQESDTDRSPRS